MSVEIDHLFAEAEPQRYALHTRYLNEQMVRVLKTIGFDRAISVARASTSMTGRVCNTLTSSAGGACSPSAAIIRSSPTP